VNEEILNDGTPVRRYPVVLGIIRREESSRNRPSRRWSSRLAVDQGMTGAAQCEPVFFGIISAMAAKLFVMNFQVGRCAARLTSPSRRVAEPEGANLRRPPDPAARAEGLGRTSFRMPPLPLLEETTSAVVPAETTLADSQPMPSSGPCPVQTAPRFIARSHQRTLQHYIWSTHPYHRDPRRRSGNRSRACRKRSR
jgi:hypothetical protein